MYIERQYYCLVAGLREYTPETDNRGFDARAIVESVREQLSKTDRRVLSLFYDWYDIVNIINIRAGRSQFNELGNFTRLKLEEGLKRPELLPEWMGRVIGAFLDPGNADGEGVDTSMRFERALFEAYYAETAESGNRFLREWHRFDRNLRNVIAAYTARDRDMPAVDALVGSDDIALSLRRSSASDFGLKGELEYIDRLLAAMDEANIIEKERAIDAIRWHKADELSEFDYFNMNTVLAYLVKVNLIHRWMALDPKSGQEMYEKLIASLSADDRIRGRAAEGYGSGDFNDLQKNEN